MTVERLQRVGVVFALLLLGVVIVSLLAGLQQLINHPIAMFASIALGTVMVLVIAKVALVAENRHTGWVRSITGPNGRWLFLILIVIWGVTMAGLASANLGPQQMGAPAFVGLLVGIFLFMGFIWSVIGE